MSTWIRRTLLALVAIAVLAALVLAFVPEPVPADIVEVDRGSMLVTVDEDGKTRIKERYIVSAPLTGRLRRQSLDPGDPVVANETVVARIDPTDPSLLDSRARAEAQARVRAADAAVHQAEANLARARSTLDFAEDELAKARTARERGATSSIELAAKEMLGNRATEEYRAAEFGIEIAKFELEQARAALTHTTGRETDPESGGEPFVIRSPIDGSVLRLFQESAAILTPGAPILELGDPHDLEIVVDVLSSDAVRIRPGDRVIVEHWGGDKPLEARVRLTEPSAFTKISALGVEEQRVNVIADLVSPVEDRPSLGDGFRVEVRIVLWEEPNVLQVPSGALFRPDGTSWEVFLVRDGRAVRHPVEVGRQNGLAAEVLGGLEAGDLVVAHPGDRVEDGVRVEPRRQR